MNTKWNAGVSYHDALANGWLLKDGSGNLLKNLGFPDNDIGDVGSDGYQHAFLANALAYLHAHPGIAGIYIDDVLVPSPFHEIENFTEGASLGVLTSEVVEDMKLLPGAYPEKFGDAVGAALDVHTREGSRGTPLVRISAGIAASDFLAEGGFGSSRKGSWLVSARKSYINYLVHGRINNYDDIGYEDADVKLSYDFTPRQSVSFLAISGPTTLNSTDIAGLQSPGSCVPVCQRQEQLLDGKSRLALGPDRTSAGGRTRRLHSRGRRPEQSLRRSNHERYLQRMDGWDQFELGLEKRRGSAGWLDSQSAAAETFLCHLRLELATERR